MNCDKVKELISLYIDNRLNDNEKNELEIHLNSCDVCKKEYEDLLTIKKMLGDMEEVQLPDNFKEEFHSKLVQSVSPGSSNGNKIKSIVNFKNKIKNRRIFNWKVLSGIAAVILLVVVSATVLNLDMGGKSQSPQMARQEVADTNEAEYKIAAGAPPKIAEESRGEASYDMSVRSEDLNMSYGVEQETTTGVHEAKEQPDEGRKVILNGYIYIEVENYDKVHEEIINLTLSKGGFIQHSHTGHQNYDKNNPEETFKYGNIVIRVPEKEFYDIYEQIKSMGREIDTNINSQDITSMYRDTVNEVENLKIQEKRLREIMEKAENVKEILEVERELTRVRGQINRLTGDIKRWDELAALSTIEVRLKEVKIKDSKIKSIDENIWDKSKKGFIKTTNRLINIAEYIFVGFVSFIPIIIVIGLLTAVIIYVVKKIKNKS